MTRPLALVLYGKLLPGSQLVNRLEDLDYRVQTVSDPALLVACAEQVKPLVVLAQLELGRPEICSALASLRQSSTTAHLPVIGFVEENADSLREAARSAGASLVVSEGAILAHLSQFLEEALRLD